jgi:hypothetical protein
MKNDLINKSVLDSIVESISKRISEDTRFFFERAGRNKPKVEALKYMIPSIIQLMTLLYSFREQLILINRTSKKFGVSDTTYYKFLQDYLPNEYLLFKKNSYFVSKLSRIKNLIDTTNLTYEKQFKALNFSGKLNGHTTLNISIEDYMFFIENYYNKDMNKFYEKIKYVSRTYIKSELNPDFLNYKPEMGTINAHIDTEIKETKLEDILKSNVLLEQIQTKNEISEIKTTINTEINEDNSKSLVEDTPIIKASKKPRENVKDSKLEIIENDSSKNYKVLKKGDLEFKLYNSSEDRKVLINDRGFYSIEVFENVEIEDYVELFPIVENFHDFPEELKNKHEYRWVQRSEQSGAIDEPFVAVFHNKYFNYLNPDTYGLCNGLLIVMGAYDNSYRGYKCYRYYEGVLYYLDIINPVLTNHYHAIFNPINSRITADSTVKSREWRKKYMDYLYALTHKNEL